MTIGISIRRHQVRITDGLDYSILFFGGALVFVMLVGDEYKKRFMHMVGIEL